MAGDDQTRVVWPFRPNWRVDYTITYEFRTDIFSADDGSEQRRALRSTPRKSLSYTALAYDDKLRQFNRLMDTAQNLSIIMPEVTRFVTTTTSVASGAVAVSVDSLPAWLTNGAEIIISDGGTYTFAQVTGIAGSVLTLDRAPGALDSGLLVHPALTGLLGQKLAAKRATNNLAEPAVEFDVFPGSETYPPTVATELYNGIEVVSLDPNWERGVGVSHEWPILITDMGRGITTAWRDVDFPATVRTYDLASRSAEAMIATFVRMRGQRGSFWASSMEPDMLPITAIGGTTLDVVGTDLYYGYREDPVRQAIEVYAPGIGRFYATITSMTITGGNTRLALVETLPAISADAVARISWLTLARFATDSLQCVYQSTGAVKTSVSIRTLPSSANEETGVLRATADSAIRDTTQGDDRLVIYL